MNIILPSSQWWNSLFSTDWPFRFKSCKYTRIPTLLYSLYMLHIFFTYIFALIHLLYITIYRTEQCLFHVCLLKLQFQPEVTILSSYSNSRRFSLNTSVSQCSFQQVGTFPSPQIGNYFSSMPKMPPQIIKEASKTSSLNHNGLWEYMAWDLKSR